MAMEKRPVIIRGKSKSKWPRNASGTAIAQSREGSAKARARQQNHGDNDCHVAGDLPPR
jgi:hypothetical protein